MCIVGRRECAAVACLNAMACICCTRQYDTILPYWLALSVRATSGKQWHSATTNITVNERYNLYANFGANPFFVCFILPANCGRPFPTPEYKYKFVCSCLLKCIWCSMRFQHITIRWMCVYVVFLSAVPNSQSKLAPNVNTIQTMLWCWLPLVRYARRSVAFSHSLALPSFIVLACRRIAERVSSYESKCISTNKKQK